MAKRRPTETIGDMLLPVITERRFTQWCAAAGLRPHTVASLIDGKVDSPRRATVLALAKALGVDPARVRAAIEASRAAASK